MNRDLLRQAQQMQAKLVKAQEELANLTAEGSAGGGAVTAVATGQGRIRSVKISPEVVDPQEVSMLEDLVAAAVNQALEKAQELATRHLEAITGGFKIPGMR